VSHVPGCRLCDGLGGRLVVQAPRWRIVHAEEPDFPGFYRLVWQEHVQEFSQLPRPEREECTELLVAIEQALIEVLQPTKVNIASLGNAVPHLHWHVIARFEWDSHFPGAVWAPAQRTVDAARQQAVAALLPEVEDRLRILAPARS
jgi:diadenosine tetraphosphate (Ap4A) HIT family hydrolase